MADCQNWQEIDSENAVNEIESVETSVEVVDNQEKVHGNFFYCLRKDLLIRKCKAMFGYL